MKMFNLVLLSTLLFSAAVHADESKESDQQCTTEARQFLAKKLKVPTSKLNFFNGACLGDGVDAIQITVFQLPGKNGLYKVEIDADGCELRNIEHVDN